MRQQTSIPRDESTPTITYLLMLVGEARAAARSLYELHPAAPEVEPLYRYLSDALTTVDEGLTRMVLIRRCHHPRQRLRLVSGLSARTGEGKI